MKRKEIRTTEQIAARTNVVTIWICDVCKEDIGQTLYQRKNHCAICERVMHDNFKCSSEYPEEGWSDYPNMVCKFCEELWYKLYKPLQDEHWKLEEEMLERVKRESLILGH